MSGNNCTCGVKFRLSEDYRDHLPCPGSALEQMQLRAEKAEARLTTTRRCADAMICVLATAGYSDSPDDAPTFLAKLVARANDAEAEGERLRDQREQDARCTACREHSNFNTLPDDEDCAECKAARAALAAPKKLPCQKCGGEGILRIQHPCKPMGVVMSEVPCLDCAQPKAKESVEAK